ncbi:MAG: glutamine--tRNA ligase, partial [Thermodesulfobacteriota bacterium]
LFKDEDPEKDKQDFIENLNPDSLKLLENCKLEKCLANAEPEKVYQFERVGYFCRDNQDSKIKNAAKSSPVFNRTVTMRDAWAKMTKKNR